VSSNDGTPSSSILRCNAAILAEKHAEWNGFGVELATRRLVGRSEIDVQLPRHLLFVALDGSARHVEYRINGGRREEALVRPGQIIFLPANQRYGAHTHGSWIYRTARIFLEPQLVDMASGDDYNPSSLDLTPSVDFQNSQVLQAMTALVREVERPGLMGRLYAESLALIMLIEVVRHHAAPRGSTGRVDVASHRLRRVTDYIEAHLGEDLSLLDLAVQAGLSPAHFAQQFKRFTGFSPHQYVLRRRVQRAADLLSLPSQSVADVALAVGFSSQSHLTAAFRRAYGTTPGVYRAESASGRKAARPPIDF